MIKSINIFEGNDTQVQSLNDSNAYAFKLDFSKECEFDIADLVELDEGINVKDVRAADGKLDHLVSIDPSHSRGIDFSLKSNPSTQNLEVPELKFQAGKVQVYSVFKRTKMDLASSSDGNPLVYVLKQEKRFKFASPEDGVWLKSAATEILEKFLSQYFSKIGSSFATLVLPTGNKLNGTFAARMQKISQKLGKNTILFDKALTKISTEDFRADVLEDGNSDFSAWLASLPDYEKEQVVDRLDMYIKDMDKSHGGIFSYHYIRDPEIRSHVSRSMKLGDEYFKDLNDSDVLLLDDTVSRGASLKEAAKLLCSGYNPKSVTALTLFSPLHPF